MQMQFYKMPFIYSAIYSILSYHNLQHGIWVFVAWWFGNWTWDRIVEGLKSRQVTTEVPVSMAWTPKYFLGTVARAVCPPIVCLLVCVVLMHIIREAE